MYFQEFFSEVLREPASVLTYDVGRHLAQANPGRALLEGSDYDFDIFQFEKAGHCVVRRDDSTHAQVAVCWSDDGKICEDARNAWYEVEWQGHALEVVLIDWENGCNPYHWIIAESDEVARTFFAAVCAFEPEVHGEVLVFDGGNWAESSGLFKQIGGATLDNLVLPDRFKREVVADVARFFAAREAYERYHVPWKRGLLFVGPPGNGKTHAIKALINATGHPCLYIKTFRSDKWIEATNIRRAFERARKCSPCLLVLEDLDSLVTDENRSFFLNELDGFAANVGILTIATTNHPGKLDPAILDRPSRFDRKYHFGLPALAERLAYVDQWNRSLEAEARLSDEARPLAAGRTEGFSFAYLKELFLSSLMAWVAAPEPRGMDAILLEQVDSLREQMKTTAEAREADAK